MKASGRGDGSRRFVSVFQSATRAWCRRHRTGRTSLRSSHSKLAAARAMAPMFPAFLLPTTTTHTSSSAAGGSRRRPRCRSHARFVMRPAEPFSSTASFHLSREGLSPRRAPPGAGRRGAAASGDFRTTPPALAGTAEVARTLSANIVPRACVVCGDGDDTRAIVCVSLGLIPAASCDLRHVLRSGWRNGFGSVAQVKCRTFRSRQQRNSWFPPRHLTLTALTVRRRISEPRVKRHECADGSQPRREKGGKKASRSLPPRAQPQR
jgi:hypothetical protein